MYPPVTGVFEIDIMISSGNLELFLHNETGVAEDCILAYLSDGRRLHNENVRELAGVQDQVRRRVSCVFVCHL